MPVKEPDGLLIGRIAENVVSTVVESVISEFRPDRFIEREFPDAFKILKNAEPEKLIDESVKKLIDEIKKGKSL